MAMSRSMNVAAVTASITQTQAGGTVLDADFSVVTCANSSDAVTIPANLPTGTVFYLRCGASAGLIYPPLGGAINGGTVNNSKPTDVNVVYMVICTLGGAASTYIVQKMAVLSA